MTNKMIVTGRQDGAGFTLVLSGRVDSNNVAAVEQSITETMGGFGGAELTVDAEALEYISSAGLRVLLRLRKKHAGMKVVNTSLDVYEIFEMTGFTEMMTVEKAYRRMDVEGCEVIGEGANGLIYRTDPETIVKVYRNPDSLADIQHEREVARTAFVLGVPTAISYDVVRVGESYASVFELLNADSMAKLVKNDPENIDKYISQYIDLLKIIHGTHVPAGKLPKQRDVGLRWVRKLEGQIPSEQVDKLRALMENVPDSDTMLHGDYHVKNVMFQDGEALLIDMDTLSVGDPVFEFAAMYLGYQGFSELDHGVVERFMGISYEQAQHIWHESLRLYLGTEDKAILQEAEDKARLCCYIRLTRRTIEKDSKNTALIEHCKRRLTEYLPRVSTLAFG